MPLDPTVAIVFGTLFLSLLLSLTYAFSKQVLKYRASKHGAAEASSRSIGVSELRALVREAAAEATQPLAERLDALEADVQRLQASYEAERPPAAEPLLRHAEAELPPEELPRPRTGTRVR